MKCAPVIGGRRFEHTIAGDGTVECAAGDRTVECAAGGGTVECAGGDGTGNASFVEALPKASSMKKAAVAAFESGTFENVAYFEPFYLKQFVATVSRKNLF